ncbi:ketol-acid reductoisomerase [Tamaricihabitans halophyticus]|uniref:Ketol-acid reductoisomerase n=1 Tax=Tamaricihabitans halophyticus TaxID=1262583 RepID=A0A4V2SUE3_9PSEU|nr:NAD(P)-binding domain-containing protein [Tamaricihabitans halophyticus]TCP54286.1 ketol-acid reductoisomerase [Tamaricihabitans halophyticus]
MGTKARIYRETDADIAALGERTVGIIGYGNQGAAQARNLRDSGVPVLVGNRADEYFGPAAEAGFAPLPIAEVADRAQVVLLLIPDEVQPEVCAEQLAPGLRAGDTLVLASGYNWAFGLLEVPAGVDVVMVAPRMIGAAVRDRFVARQGYPCFVSVERDASGSAWPTALAIAAGIGAAVQGAIESSAREEAALDLFTEQAIWPAIMDLLSAAYAVQRDVGFSDEAILHEMYLSAEPAEVFARAAEHGLLGQLPLHSRTSQYGQLRGLAELGARDNPLREYFERVLHQDILSGAFAAEWSQPEAMASLERLRAAAQRDPLHHAEREVRGS